MKKEILIIDESKRSTELLKLIVSEFTFYSTIIETNKTKILDIIDYLSFEYIIIDHIIDFSDELISIILDKIPNQKIILLSDHIKCPLSCADCSNLFKVVRLIKPINVNEILNYLNVDISFICPNINRFDSIKSLDELFNFINLDENIHYIKKELLQDKILLNTLNGNFYLDEFLKIEKLINESYFGLQLNQNNDIEIFVK